MSKALLFAAVSLAATLPFTAMAKTAPAESAAPASSSATTTAPADQTAAPAASAPTSSAPATSAPATGSTAGASAATGTSADANATAPAFAVGTPVKDNTGATIGSISELKPGASGAQMATIAMGQDKFSVATTGLAMQDGAAVINMTQADLQSKLHPAAPK